MLVNLIEISPEAYPLLVNHLLHHPLVHSPDQEIVYRDLRRRTYRKPWGSALPRSLARAALERGVDVHSGYEQSASCPMLTSAHIKSQS